MGAKKKLNSANLLGAFIVAGLLGALTESWTVFLLAAVILLLAAVHAGDIRLR